MKKPMIIMAIGITLFACKDNEYKEFNRLFANIEGTWYMQKVEEVRFSNIAHTETAVFPSSLSVTFKACDYKASGNHCFATIKFGTQNPFDIEYNAGKTGLGAISLGFVYPKDQKLQKSDSLFISGSWAIEQIEANKLNIVQRFKLPLYDMVMVR